MLVEGWFISSMEKLVTQAFGLKWVVRNKKLLVFLYFSSRQILNLNMLSYP